MTGRKRRRLLSSLLLVLIVLAFVVNLPAFHGVRHDVAVHLNKTGYNTLWSPRVFKLAVNKEGTPDAWFSTLHDVFTHNLESLGELRRLQIPISKSEHDELHRLQDNWNIPRSYVECTAKPNDDGTHSFIVLLGKHDQQEWECFFERHKHGDVKIAGD